MTKEYPLFPYIPESCCEDDRTGWTKKQAEEYFDWFVNMLEPRLKIMLDYYDERFDNNSYDTLLRIGGKAVAELKKSESWRQGGKTTIKFATGDVAIVDQGKLLTKRGYSIAADMGVLLAYVLLNDFAPTVKWDLIERPKNDVFYLHPVLAGCGLPFEAIHVSVICSMGIIEGNKTPDVWAETYLELKKDVGKYL